MHHRTNFVRTLMLALALGGCTTATTGTGLTPDAVAKFSALSTGLLSIAGTEASILGATPDQVGRINADAQLAQNALAALQPGIALVTAQPTAQTIATEVNDVLSIVGKLPLPPEEAQIVLALRVLLPVAEATVGLPAPASAAPGGMTPARAQAVLEAAKR